jgi:hypothetical protein
MMGRPPKLTEADIPRVKAIMAKMTTPTQREVGEAMGVRYDTFRHFTRRHKIEFPHETFLIPTVANGLSGQLFAAAKERRISAKKIAQQIGANQRSILNWRVGHGQMTLFQAQCFADLVGLELTLVPKEPS